MNETAFGLKVAACLSRSNRELDQRVAERLRAARAAALAHADDHGWSAQGSAGWGGRRAAHSPALATAAMLLLVLASFGVGGQWSSMRQIESARVIDTALLIDDLPIEAYLDPEFRAWLARESRS